MINTKVSSKIAFVFSGLYSLIFFIFAVYKGIILYFVQKAMEDTFVGGETSSISITLWFVISGILAFATILFFYFTKVKDLKSQKILLTGTTISWIFISILQLFLFKKYFYFLLFTIILILICYLAIRNLKIEILKDLNQKGLSEKEIHLLQLLAGIKKK